MLKRDEVLRSDSCLNKTLPDEPIFVLRAKDPAASITIDEWIHTRIELGLNQPGDEKLQEAAICASQMASWRLRQSGL